MCWVEPWLEEIPVNVHEMDLEYQKRHYIYAYNHETESGHCITWPELIRLIRSREGYQYTFTMPVTRECFGEILEIWQDEAREIYTPGYHEIDGWSWDINSAREVVKMTIGFLAAAGDGPDSDGYGRSRGTYFMATIGRDGHLISPFSIRYD